jgi:hypothetical protein
MEKQKKFYNYNFSLTQEEKQLFFNLKKLHKLNNRLGGTNETYYSFICGMNEYYEKILEDNQISTPE